MKINFVLKQNPNPIPFDELISLEASVQNEGMFNSRVQKCMLVGRLLCVGIAKSLPVFEKLTLSDQVLFQVHEYESLDVLHEARSLARQTPIPDAHPVRAKLRPGPRNPE